VSKSIRIYAERLGCELVELNVQPDHVHLLVKVPPKVSISKLMGTDKGRTVLQIFRQFPYLKQKPYWGNHFWAKGYCVDTVGIDAEMIRKYVKYQEENEKQLEIDFN
jgi:putative transposase